MNHLNNRHVQFKFCVCPSIFLHLKASVEPQSFSPKTQIEERGCHINRPPDVLLWQQQY